MTKSMHRSGSLLMNVTASAQCTLPSRRKISFVLHHLRMTSILKLLSPTNGKKEIVNASSLRVIPLRQG